MQGLKSRAAFKLLQVLHYHLHSIAAADSDTPGFRSMRNFAFSRKGRLLSTWYVHRPLHGALAANSSNSTRGMLRGHGHK